MLKRSQILTLAMALMLVASPSTFANPGAEAALTLVRSMETGIAATRSEAGALSAVERASIETRALRVLAENQGLSPEARAVFAGAKTIAAIDVTSLSAADLAIAQQTLAAPATYSRTGQTAVTLAMEGRLDLGASRKDGVMGATSPRGPGPMLAKDTMADVEPVTGGRPVMTKDMTAADRAMEELLSGPRVKQEMVRVNPAERSAVSGALRAYAGRNGPAATLEGTRGEVAYLVAAEANVSGPLFDEGASTCIADYDLEAQDTFTKMNGALAGAGNDIDGSTALGVMAGSMSRVLTVDTHEATSRICALAAPPCNLYGSAIDNACAGVN